MKVVLKLLSPGVDLAITLKGRQFLRKQIIKQLLTYGAILWDPFRRGQRYKKSEKAYDGEYENFCH